MTREEQIIAEAKKYYSGNIQCYAAFLHGTEFADEHPINVWHTPSEEPQEIDAQIICNAASLTCPEGMTYVETTLRGIMHISSSWQDWARRYNLKAWAYLDDLLPSDNVPSTK